MNMARDITKQQYKEALERHGAFKGSYLTIRRLLRCPPWGGSGFDPVPPHSHD
jgi:putative component of membrane protein insertase Oxa1/YidC/SpoIIIJ protein YidD